MGDPALLYSNYYHPYAYNPGYLGYPYAHPYGHYYGKREAEAEPEADPALIYTTNTLTSAVHHSPLVSPLVYTAGLHQPIIYNSAVHSPVVYNSAFQAPVVYNTALTSPVLSKVFPSLKTLTTAPVVSHIAKREAEAEADPALVYTTTAGVHQPVVYKTPVHTPLLKTVDNAVVPSVGGYIHS